MTLFQKNKIKEKILESVINDAIKITEFILEEGYNVVEFLPMTTQHGRLLGVRITVSKDGNQTSFIARVVTT